MSSSALAALTEAASSSLAGGALIGLASAGMLLLLGRIAGISGILHNAVRPSGAAPWRWAFLAGLIGAGLIARWAGVAPPPALASLDLKWLLAAGLLVGFGTRLGSGCTSGHGVCGLANLSPRSLLATLVFMLTAGLTVYVMRHLGAAVG